MSRKILSLLGAITMLAAVSQAQCLNTSGGTAITLTPTGIVYPADDEGLSAPLPLGFAFPIGGGTFTHVVVESNGVAYLTNGGPAVGATQFGFADMIGVAGDSPRIAAFWTDLEGLNAGTAWQISVDTSVPGAFKINWINVNEFAELGQFSFQAVLYSSGIVDLTSAAGAAVVSLDLTIGISAGNGVIASSSDLSAGPTSTVAALYEDFIGFPTPVGVADIVGSTTTFIPAGAGYTVVRTCGAASHTAYGAGCSGMSLSASPAPISTATSGTTVVYAISNIPVFAPGSGLYVALNVFSLGQIPAPGLDLTFLGAPGCVGLVQSLDFTQTVVGTSPNQSTSFVLPAGIPAGTQIFVQAASLLATGGLATSNGINSLIQPF
ncbi:MAG: hypothetical protein MUC36_28105 [Planctomycetes bacterium]|jgi:hypothetical protein|nr:hypothetical protein [Planctomycetota bacterium]